MPVEETIGPSVKLLQAVRAYDEATFEYTIAVLGINNSSGSSQDNSLSELSDGGPPQDVEEGVNKAQALFSCIFLQTAV